MSEEPTSSARQDTHSHWLGWTLGLVAVPLVYLLALPPIVFAMMKDWKTGRSTSPSKTVMLVVKPYDWIAESTPLKRPLDTYVQWWRTGFFGPTMPMPTPPPPPAKAP